MSLASQCHWCHLTRVHLLVDSRRGDDSLMMQIAGELAPNPARAVLGYDTNGDGELDAFDTNQDGHIDVRSEPAQQHSTAAVAAVQAQLGHQELEQPLVRSTVGRTRDAEDTGRHWLQQGRGSVEELPGDTEALTAVRASHGLALR